MITFYYFFASFAAACAMLTVLCDTRGGKLFS